ncbi:MAG: hypothetical protein FWC41_04265 [Firmicutes bacterium]|nr:hypothetical protein [Bacillota bacterium]
MRKTITLIVALLGLTTFLNAQINDTFIVTPNDVTLKKNRGFDEITIEGCSFTNEIGNPQLPVKVLSFVLPYNSTVTGIDINSVVSEKLNGNYYIFPAQPPRRLDGSEPPPFVEPNPEIYGSSAPVNVLCYFYNLK